MIVHLITLLFLLAAFALAAVFSSPIRLRFDAVKKDLEVRAYVSVFFFWNTFSVKANLLEEYLEFRLLGWWVYTLSLSRKEPKKSVETGDGGVKDLGTGFDFRWSYIKPFSCFVRRIIRSFRFELVDLNLVFGLHDPADTGMYCGYLYALLYPFNSFRNVDILVSPDFDGTTLDGSLCCVVMNRLVDLFYAFLVLAFDLRVWVIAFRRLRSVF
ncbi:MAG: hypothetical protein B6U97_02915 [Candidatus Altiarchaeales archaeon ex4484_96]|nr:MAG: hypothetical protein B6U97_02915 [Candidatus Altiarchaeales archaeon ex4484_96]